MFYVKHNTCYQYRYISMQLCNEHFIERTEYTGFSKS